MPKISGPNIAQHVANQEAAVFEAATRLFAVYGVDTVSMGAIAEEVGLARPSLYRYFPTKSSIVVRWFERAMGPLISESNLLAASDVDRGDKFDAWIDRQVEFLLDAGNRAMISASLAVGELSDEQRHLIGRRHRDLYASLQRIVLNGAQDIDHESVRVRVLLIVDLLRGLGDLTDRGVPPDLARSEILRASRLIAEIDPTTTTDRSGPI